jgi:phenylacetate-CoA ligase
MFNNTTPEKQKELQLHLLFKTLGFAHRNIPFYNNHPNVTSIEDFQRLPIITKNDILTNFKDFLLPSSKHIQLQANTGGSSGNPMSFYLHKGLTRPKEKAHFDWYWQLFGYKSNERMLMIRGNSLKNNALYEYQSITNKLVVSCYELNEHNIQTVINAIKKYNPHFIHAYPSALKNFCRCIGDKQKISDISIKTIFLGSEYLPPDYKSCFKDFFNAKIVNWYGHSECILHGGYSPESDNYTFYPFYGYIELVNDNGEIIVTPGESGRIIGTSFDNNVMPFIRYDTGDRGTLESINGANVVLKSIDGRNQDFIVLNDKTQVTLTAFIFGQHLPQFNRIIEMQLYQDTFGKLLIKIVPNEDFSSIDKLSICDFLEKSVSNKIKVNIELVKVIEKTHRGKHRFLIQKIKGI